MIRILRVAVAASGECPPPKCFISHCISSCSLHSSHAGLFLLHIGLLPPTPPSHFLLLLPTPWCSLDVSLNVASRGNSLTLAPPLCYFQNFVFAHFFRKYLLSVHYMSGTVLDPEDTSVSKSDKRPCPHGA